MNLFLERIKKLFKRKKSSTMTIQEAISEMEAGKKLTHNYFNDTEFLTMVDGQIIDEDGIHHDNFFEARKGEHWQTGWSYYKEKQG